MREGENIGEICAFSQRRSGSIYCQYMQYILCTAAYKRRMAAGASIGFKSIGMVLKANPTGATDFRNPISKCFN